MPTYGISDIIGWEMKDGNGNIVLSHTIKQSKLSRQEKLDPKNIKKVIFNPPATIVIFRDDTKVVAKAHNEDFDEEKGFMACMMQIMFPSRAEFNRVIDKGIEESYKIK